MNPIVTATSSRARTVVAVLIPIVWFIAMGVSRHGEPTAVMFVTALLLCAAVFAARALEPERLIPNARAVVIGIAAGAVMIGGTWAGFFVMKRTVPALLKETPALYGHLNGSRWAAVLVLAVVVGEEILWRGAFQSYVEPRVRNRIVAIFVCAIVYAVALTSFGSPLLVGVGLTCGLYWSALRNWSGSAVPPLIAHVVWDAALMLIPLAM